MDKKISPCCHMGSKCDCVVLHQDKVDDSKSKMLKDDILGSIVEFYKALGDKTRIKIINALESNEHCVCDLAYMLNMTKSAVSHQLKYLIDMGLVKGVRQGKEIFYSLDDEHIKLVFDISYEHIIEKNK